MKFKELGLGTGLAIGGSLMLGGYMMQSVGSSGGDGGIMIVLGFLVLIVGAFVAVSAIIVWIFSTLYGSLGTSSKRRLRWGIFVLVLGWFVWSGIDAYLYSRPSAMAARQEAWDAQAKLDRLATTEKLETARGYLVGAWQTESLPGTVDVFEDQGMAYRITNGEIDQHGPWSLTVDPQTASSDLLLTRRINTGDVVSRLLEVDDSRLVIEVWRRSTTTPSKPNTEIQTYRRLTDVAALPKFDPATIPPKEQPAEREAYGPFASIASTPITAELEVAETKTIDGIVHQFYKNPIAVTTGGGSVRSGPGTTHSRVTSMVKGDPVVLLAVTDADQDGYLWFQIRYRDGKEGYAYGGLLCARESWIEGLHKQCPIFFR